MLVLELENSLLEQVEVKQVLCMALEELSGAEDHADELPLLMAAVFFEQLPREVDDAFDRVQHLM